MCIVGMAAKQGTLAQLSAQAEDAKRAVLSKAGASSWFSNLNTVCTIKSAPPRSPEVLQLLATKAGWLYKRNEQHVWQARWCCVVPHTFLYYFDAPVVGNNNCCVQNPSAAQQNEWNKATIRGLGNRKPHEKRSHFPLFHAGGAAAVADAAISEDGDTVSAPNTQNLQPAGIIDLECYSTLYRSSENAAILQLAGDDQVNPDLRPFYFCCENSHEVEEWNSALLNNRHAALQDEVEAYKQVADGFAQQLQLLHSDLDDAMARQEESEQVLYRVRSVAEETRRTVYRIAEECWERPLSTMNPAVDISRNAVQLQEKRTDLRRNMETIRQQDMGVGAAVRLLADYIASTEDLCLALQQSVKQLQTDVQKSGQTDLAEIQELQAATAAAAKKHEAEKEQLLQQLAAAQAASQASSKELKDVQKDLSSTKMEVTMLMSQQRNKLATQQQHKKILKKEVIDLRQKVEDVVSEHSSLQHECEKVKLLLEQERSKSDLLSRHIEMMESQVQVQQNMMEMMSHTGGGSVYGGGGPTSCARSTSSRNNDFTTPSRRNNNNNNNNIIYNRNSVKGGDDDEDDDHFDDDNADHVDEDDVVDEDFENDERMLSQPPNIPASPAQYSTRRRRMMNHHQPQHYNSNINNSTTRGFLSDNDADNKSHLSELTEDRTQREFAAIQSSHHQYSSLGGGGDYQHSHHGQLDSQLHAAAPTASPSLRKKQQQDARHRKRTQEQQRLAHSPRLISGPPSVIIGVKKSEASSDSNDGDNSNHQKMTSKVGPSSRGLETINSSSGSVRSKQGSGSISGTTSSPLLGRRDIPRKSIGRDSVSVSSIEHVSSLDGSGTKLSVAQRARLEADYKSTPVRARLDEKSLSSLQRQNSGNYTTAAAAAAVGVATSSQLLPAFDDDSKSEQQKTTPGSQNSQSSGLWRRVEEAVLGARLDEDDDSYTSEESTRITDYTDGDDQKRDAAKHRFAANRDRAAFEEKKSSDSVVSSSVSDKYCGFSRLDMTACAPYR